MIVVVAYHAAQLLRECLNALDAGERVVVLDNSSDTKVREVAQSWGAHYVDPERNLGFAAGVNAGVAHAGWRGEDIVLLNPDARIDSRSLDVLTQHLHEDTETACVSPRLRGVDGSEQRVMWPLPSPSRMLREAAGLAKWAQPDEFAVGSALVINGAAWQDVGPMDERYFLYAEEADWQRRARARGWVSRCVRDVVAEHVGAGTSTDEVRRQALFHAGQETYIRTWYGERGWRTYRQSAVLGAAVRGSSLTRRTASWSRAQLYRRGPRSVAELPPLVPPARLHIVQVVVTDAFAGTERYVVDVSTELSRRGHLVSVVGGNAQIMRAQLPRAVRWLPGSNPTEAAISRRRLGWAHVIHTHLTAAEIAMYPLTQLSACSVTTRHIAAPRGTGRVARTVGRLAAASIDRQFAISEFVADVVEPPTTILVNGVPDRPDRQQSGQRLVLVAQRLEKEKATDGALRAWAASGLADAGWRLRIAGSGTQADVLAALASELGIETSVDFLGQVQDLEIEWRLASVFLAPAPSEPLGLSVLEAMAHGLPVVAAAGGGHLETVGGVPNAALFPPGDVRVAGRLLSELATGNERRARYGEALRGLQRQRFSVTRHVDVLLEHYRELLDAKTRS